MTLSQRLLITVAFASLPLGAMAQVSDLPVPPVAGELTEQQVARAGDDKLSCSDLRGEVRQLVAVVRQKEEAAEKVQAASFDRAAAERQAAANKARAAAQAQTDKARVEAKTKVEPPKAVFDPNKPIVSTPTILDGAPVTSAEFKGAKPTITPTQMRQYRLAYIAYEKGC